MAGEHWSEAEKAHVVKKLLRELEKGRSLRAALLTIKEPRPLRFKCFTEWMAKDPELRLAVDEAYEAGCDALMEIGQQIADGVLPPEGHPNMKPNVLRDKLRTDWIARRLGWMNTRFRDRMVHENDPTNPVPAPTFLLQPVKSVSQYALDDDVDTSGTPEDADA